MNQRVDFILPECYVDTNLVETLLHAAGCNHQKGCNQVVKVMREKFADRFAVGVMDADKRRPGYLAEFVEIASSSHLQLLRHPARPHYIILVKPAIDGFILAVAQESGVIPEDFGLSSRLKEFTLQTKNVMSNKDARFKALFKALSPYGEFRLFKRLIEYLSTATYTVAPDRLVSFFERR